MTAKVTGSPELSPELAAFLKEQVDRGIAEAVQEKNSKISDLNEMIVQVTQEKERISERLTAAESIIEEFQRKVTDLQENASTDEDLQERYAAATSLLEEAVPRLQNLGDAQRRLEAAESLLSVSIDRHKQESVNRAIDTHLNGVAEEAAEKIRPFLEECDTAEEVETRLQELQGLVETFSGVPVATREPLPTGDTQTVTEETQVENKQLHSDWTTSRLMSKLAGVVA